MKRILYTLALLFASLQTFARTYTYDNLNRLAKVSYDNGITITYTFDALGNRTGTNVTGFTTLFIEDFDEDNPPDTDISQIDNTLYVGPVTATAGTEMILSVKMKNTVEAEGFQFDLVLPDGVTVAKDADGFAEANLSTERTTARKTNTFDCAFLADGSLRVIAGSTNGSVISGNDGEVATVKLAIDENLALGNYPIVLRNISISDTEAKSHDVDYVKSTLSIGTGVVLGDVNGDGTVDISDYIGVANHILGNTPAGFNATAADVNNDGEIDISDYIGVANIILTGKP